MNQKKIGMFIAELRKEKGLTQKQLAEQLNITNKAVSKWECGYCLPDNSVMLNLCNVLGITVNELLSGTRLSSTDYNKKAEENIMTLIQENDKNQKRSIRQLILGIIAIILLTIYFMWFVSKKYARHSRNKIFCKFFRVKCNCYTSIHYAYFSRKIANIYQYF